MRLVSKFQDYYDAAGLAYGIDDKLIYVRKTEDIVYNQLPVNQVKLLDDYIDNLPKSRGWSDDFIIIPGVLGFCGKLYPVYSYQDSYNSETGEYFSNFTKFAKDRVDLPKSIFKPRGKNTSTNIKYFTTRAEAWCFELAEGKYGGILAEDIFYSLKVPVFLRWGGQVTYLNREYQPSITINPNLKELGFQHIVDPLTAFQEVSMFVGSLNSRNENKQYTVGDDSVIAQQKGHCVKESFRQVAPTKKSKRKLNKQSKKNVS